MTPEIEPEVIEAIKEIVDYSWSEEAADYAEQGYEDEEDGEFHIFVRLKRVAAWLEGLVTCATG